MNGLLVVAGEASGDRAAAAVVARLEGVPSFGMGGAALASVGTDLVADLRDTTALGVSEASSRLFAIARSLRAVSAAARARRPRAALLVNYTEFNARLAKVLHAEGIPVLWYGAPQIWAWRAGRGQSLRRFVDRMAVVLPFEEPLWRSLGVDATYVGHPAFDTTPLDRDTARRVLGMTALAPAVALLPGSRPHEVERLLEPMIKAFEWIRQDRASVDARLLIAPSLDETTRRRAVALASKAHIDLFEVDPHTGAYGVLAAFDVALCASGTASLEAAISRVVPVVAYRVGLATELVARAFLRVPHVALPNVLLGRRAFEEVLQRDVTADRLAAALAHALDQRADLLAACDEVAAILGPRRPPSQEVARMLLPWLAPRVHGVARL